MYGNFKRNAIMFCSIYITRSLIRDMFTYLFEGLRLFIFEKLNKATIILGASFIREVVVVTSLDQIETDLY